MSVFSDLSDDELDNIARVASQLDVAAGDALTTAGEFGHALFAIESGSAEVSIDGKLVRVVGPGDVVGDVAVLASGRRTASVVATSPLRVIALFKRDVWALERQAPEAARRLRAAVDRHLAATQSLGTGSSL